jgi:TrmH family RNA methyltransferase
VRVLATVRVSRQPLAELLAGLREGSWLLVGERIQDPRNVGVLVRTADAWGLGAVAFTEGSADPFSRGAVRSSTGSILRVRVTTEAGAGELLKGVRERGLRIVGASAAAERPCWEVDMRPSCAVVVGNEATGLSEEARRQCDVVARIPMYGGAHSFNVTVAAGILLYEARRQREAGGIRTQRE